MGPFWCLRLFRPFVTFGHPSRAAQADLHAQVVVVKGNSGFAGEVDERSAERQQRGHEQKRNAIFVGDIEQRADEGNDDDEGGEDRREDGAE